MTNTLYNTSNPNTVTANGDTATLTGVSNGWPVAIFREVAVDFNVSAVSGVLATITFGYERLGADGVWYEVWSSGAVSVVKMVSTTIGAGCMTPQSVGRYGRLTWKVSGTAPSFIFTCSVTGK